MAGGAAPAPPTLAAARPRVAHERPMAVPRDPLAPTHRRQPPARSHEAPILHMQLCTCPSWAYSHAQLSAHCLAAHVHAQAAAAISQQQQQHQKHQRRRQRQHSRRHHRQLAMVCNGSQHQLHFSSSRNSASSSSAFRQLPWQTRQPFRAPWQLCRVISVNCVSLDSKGSQWQIKHANLWGVSVSGVSDVHQRVVGSEASIQGQPSDQLMYQLHDPPRRKSLTPQGYKLGLGRRAHAQVQCHSMPLVYNTAATDVPLYATLGHCMPLYVPQYATKCHYILLYATT